ncbi:MAG: ABC transporter ATP-binding protein [Oscillospiraceae bacterium]|nr:ABC transporter ATP-binding protein [Oscillospiraceae bacterium]
MKKYYKQNRRAFFAALVSILVSTVFAVWLQFFKGDVLDHAIAGALGETLRSVCLLMSFILAEVGSYYVFQRFSAKYAIGCISHLRRDIFGSILRRSYADYRKYPQGEYIAKYMTETEAIRDRLFRMQPRFWEILLRIILVSGALFLLDWRIALITIALLTTPLYVPKLIEARLQKAQTAYLQTMEENLSRVTDWLSAFEIIKNFSIEEKIRARFDGLNDDAMDKLMRDTNLGAAAQLITTLMSYLSYFIVLVCAAWLVVRGDFSAGDFFVAIGMIDQLSWPLISLAGIIQQLVAIRPACDAMEEFLDVPETVRTAGKTGFEREIRFRDVSFSYDRQRQILEGFDLTVQKGNRYLLKGPSGCGKTTVVNLLLRYYGVNGGSITIDDIPLEQTGDPYALMTVVRQEAVLFHDTLRSNLTMYRDIPDADLMQMLKSVGLERLAGFLDMEVAEGGSNFSGGEKKRICLARALLRDTEVLILDEPLANLDAETAERIEDLLLGIPGKTILVVSHQFTESKLQQFDAVINFA